MFARQASFFLLLILQDITPNDMMYMCMMVITGQGPILLAKANARG